MMKQFLHKSLIVILCQSLVYAPLLRAAQLSLPSGDLVAPEISQEQYINTVKKGADHAITVTVTDNVGVKQVTLYYKTIGTEEYKRTTMDSISNTDDYHTTINSDQIKPPGLEYYIQAMDNAGNTVLHGYSFSPLSVTMSNADTANVATTDTTPITTEEESSNIWLWVGLGALAVVGLLAAGGSSDDGGGEPTATTGTVSITGPTP